MRTLVIGDIHGGLKALVQLLERVKITKKDTLIFLGDYVDGWSDSVKLIDYLIALDKKYQCIFIKGNHDIWCENWLKTNEANTTWLQHGGFSTFELYQLENREIIKKHLSFFEKMPFYYISDDKDLFIHAGFTSMHGPKKEFHKSNYNWDRTLWEMAVTMDRRIKKHSVLYPKRLKLFREIYIGHTLTLHYNRDKPMNAINVWNLDTGAGFIGKLSCIDIKTKEVWQSDEVYTFYPNEKGRN